MSKIYRVTPDGKRTLSAYDSVQEAAQRTGFVAACISRAVETGRRYNGFCWRTDAHKPLALDERVLEKRESLRRLQKHIKTNSMTSLVCRGLCKADLYHMSQCERVSQAKWDLLKRQLDKFDRISQQKA